MGKFLRCAKTAVTDSLAAAAEEYAEATDGVSKATDVGIRDSRETETPIFVWDADPITGFTVKSQQSAVVILTDELVEALKDDEAEAVIQHELAHADDQSNAAYSLVSVALTGLPFIVGRYVSKRSGKTKGFIVFAAGEALALLVTRWMSRQREFDADERAAEAMGTPEPLARALQRLAAEAEQPLDYSFGQELLATHPSIRQRVKRLTGEEPDETLDN